MVKETLKDKLYIMRDEKYHKGLEDLIEYVNTFSNTKNIHKKIGFHSTKIAFCNRCFESTTCG